MRFDQIKPYFLVLGSAIIMFIIYFFAGLLELKIFKKGGFQFWLVSTTELPAWQFYVAVGLLSLFFAVLLFFVYKKIANDFAGDKHVKGFKFFLLLILLMLIPSFLAIFFYMKLSWVFFAIFAAKNIISIFLICMINALWS